MKFISRSILVFTFQILLSPWSHAATEGWVDIANCNQIAGWAFNPSDTSESVVQINVDGGQQTFSTTSTYFRPDLLAAGIGDGKHGFAMATPYQLLDGKTHSIQVVGEDGTQLSTPPSLTSISCPGLAQPEGFLEQVNCSGIAGWAWDPYTNDAPVNVIVSDEGWPTPQSVSVVSANLFRSDLLAAGKGNGQHGFWLPMPQTLKDGLPHTITAYFNSTHGVVTLHVITNTNISCSPF